jgi:hypothetical protein
MISPFAGGQETQKKGKKKVIEMVEKREKRWYIHPDKGRNGTAAPCAPKCPDLDEALGATRRREK